MALNTKPQAAKLVANSDHATGIRTIGGLLGQLNTMELDREQGVRILMGSGLPAQAYDDPSFPISPKQDFEILNEIRKHMWTNASMEVGMFNMYHYLKVPMFGLLGLAWQCAPTIRDVVEVSVAYPQMNWGRTQMSLTADEEGVYVEHKLERVRAHFDSAEDAEATYRYALLLDIVATAAIVRDITRNRRLLVRVELPFPQPFDWGLIENTLPYAVDFGAERAALVFQPGLLSQVPRHANAISFKMATQLLQKESAILGEDITIAEQVSRWLWAYTPPMKKDEIAKLLGVSVRSLTRQLSEAGTSYNELFAQVQSERARNLLADSKLTISQVAYRMGYSDPAAFTRAFTAHHQQTPSKWRAHNI